MEVLGIGLPELILIVLVLLLLFGATKLPELGRSIGTFGKEVRGGFAEEEPKAKAKKPTAKK